MKKLSMFALGLLALWLCLGCAHAPSPLVGSWEIVSAEGDPADLAKDRDSLGLRGKKILNDTHFAFGEQAPDGGVWAGGGRYLYEGGTYTEIIEYHSIPELAGLSIEFQCRLDGKLWYHSAEFEAGGRWYRINQIWRRIEE
jgi:hypothetical protein